MMKKILTLVLALAMVTTLAACGGNPTPVESTSGTSEGSAQKLSVAFVIGSSISDGSFGTISYEGIQYVKDEPFIERTEYVEGITAATDAAKAIRDYVADGYDVVWAQSGQHSATVMEIAAEFPDNVFVAVGAPPSDKTLDNVWFNSTEHEGSYYVSGALAAEMSQSGTIGFVGGREHPLYNACAKAYEEGAQSVNPSIKVLSVFTGDYNDPIKAKEAAASQIQGGADVIVHLQDLGMTGIFAAAEEATQAGNQVWVIGKGNDQFNQAPDVMLTSVVYDYGVQMKNILSEIAAGNRSGVMLQHMDNGSVYLADYRGRVPEDAVARIDELIEKVMTGNVTYTTQYDIVQAE